MTERPILFSAPMVRALLAGTKTQTRRVCKPAANLSAVVEVPDPLERGQVYNGSHFGDEDGEVQFACPYGQPGDRLWVRETFGFSGSGYIPDIHFRATNPEAPILGRWYPSIHMRRIDSRITLEITSVRVERLQEISIEDAKAEGAWGPDDSIVQKVADYFGTDIFSANPRKAFQMLWESINGPDSWAANPWVWAIEFRRVP